MSNQIKSKIHISRLEQGMTVEVNGKLHTVGKNDLKYNALMGYSFLGDASKKYVTRIKFAVPTAKGIEVRG